jgi:hypothetical protein
MPVVQEVLSEECVGDHLSPPSSTERRIFVSQAATKPPNFSEWLKLRGHDETALPQERLNQFMNFFKGEQADLAANPPPVAKDSAGAVVNVGDVVTISLKVTGIHPYIDPETGKVMDGVAALNLGRILADGSASHAFSLASSWVKKA